MEAGEVSGDACRGRSRAAENSLEKQAQSSKSISSTKSGHFCVTGRWKRLNSTSRAKVSGEAVRTCNSRLLLEELWLMLRGSNRRTSSAR